MKNLNRRKMLGLLGSGSALATLPACMQTPSPSASTAPILAGSSIAPSDVPPNNPVSKTLENIAQNLLKHEPMRATELGVDKGEYAGLRHKLEDRSAAGQAAYAASLRKDLDKLRIIDRTALDPATRTSLEVVKSAYTNALEGFALPYGDVAVGSWRNAPYGVIQNVGAYIDIPRSLDADHPIREMEDVHAYMSRLSQYPDVLDGELGRISAAREMGVVPPDFLLDKAIAQMETSIADAQNGGGLVSSLTGRIVEKLGEDALGEWGERAHSITTQSVAPALERQLDELRQQRALATSDAGMWARPHGDEYYDWALRASTTTTRSPDEIHQLGIETLADIHAQMDVILRSLGYSQGEVGERMVGLSKDPRFQFAEGDPGRAQIMEFIQGRVDWIRTQMPRAFSRIVPANLEVRRLPLAEEPGAPTAYGGAGSKDGTIPGKMWINLRTTDLHRRYDLPSLVHHETIPGHVWQGEYSNQLPLIRSILAFNAFSEGWALYAEQLADELGAYEDNPAWRLGYLQDQAYRAVRLVVDTGMHSKRWSRDRAKNYFQTKVGKPEGEATNEIDRYCSWPGQACGYMVGKLEMLRQRERAQLALGAGFDLPDFNLAVVEGGNVPLDVLGGNVARHIEAVSAVHTDQ